MLLDRAQIIEHRGAAMAFRTTAGSVLHDELEGVIAGMDMPPIDGEIALFITQELAENMMFAAEHLKAEGLDFALAANCAVITLCQDALTFEITNAAPVYHAERAWRCQQGKPDFAPVKWTRYEDFLDRAQHKDNWGVPYNNMGQGIYVMQFYAAHFEMEIRHFGDGGDDRLRMVRTKLVCNRAK